MGSRSQYRQPYRRDTEGDVIETCRGKDHKKEEAETGVMWP